MGSKQEENVVETCSQSKIQDQRYAGEKKHHTLEPT